MSKWPHQDVSGRSLGLKALRRMAVAGYRWSNDSFDKWLVKATHHRLVAVTLKRRRSGIGLGEVFGVFDGDLNGHMNLRNLRMFAMILDIGTVIQRDIKS